MSIIGWSLATRRGGGSRPGAASPWVLTFLWREARSMPPHGPAGLGVGWRHPESQGRRRTRRLYARRVCELRICAVKNSRKRTSTLSPNLAPYTRAAPATKDRAHARPFDPLLRELCAVEKTQRFRDGDQIGDSPQLILTASCAGSTSSPGSTIPISALIATSGILV